MEDIFNGLGIEIEIKEKDDFLKIRETLTRIGVSSRKENKLYQSCHILHKRGRYAILHFKELFIMDGLESDISDNDIERRNTIVGLLEEWGLLEILDEEYDELPKASLAQIKIIPHKEKDQWELVPKYHIGKK
jgi:hypothetical protein|tara:strand:+ start:183 stop:581 length:399 start_codon:yes stop_codon:yes gene_type:complete